VDRVKTVTVRRLIAVFGPAARWHGRRVIGVVLSGHGMMLVGAHGRADRRGPDGGVRYRARRFARKCRPRAKLYAGAE